jgi:peptide deformylase
MYKIVKFPNSILREKINKFDFNNSDIDPVQLEKDLLECMYVNDGMGLSANQVGLRYRVFVMGHKDSPQLGKAFFNPEVISSTDNLEDLPEGCLSFPDIYVKVKRPSAIKVRWQNSQGEWHEGEFRGYDCKCFLHELDHLEGITFKDRVGSVKWTMATSKNKRIG